MGLLLARVVFNVCANDIAFAQVTTSFTVLVSEALTLGENATKRIETDGVALLAQITLACNFAPANANKMRVAVLWPWNNFAIKFQA